MKPSATIFQSARLSGQQASGGEAISANSGRAKIMRRVSSVTASTPYG
jgi:hypothetical protein